MIAAHGVTVRAGGAILLQGVSVQLRPGRVTALLGANGAGKSTLLRLLSGEIGAASGKVLLDGAPLPGTLALSRRRAVLGQHQDLAFPLETAEVVALGRLPHAGTPAARADAAAIDAVCADFALAPLWRRAYPQMSGGERQRAQLARVAAQLWGVEGSTALFLDEPTAALDIAQQALALRFARRAADGGAAVLIVLHDPNQAARVADDAVLLQAGRVLAQGAAREVLVPAALEACFGVPIEALTRADGTMALLPQS